MSERERENGEESIDEAGRNPTQQRLDREGVEDVPVAPSTEVAPGKEEG